MLKRIGKTLLWLGVALVVTTTGAFGYRAWRQATGERLIAIATPNGIDEGLFVNVRGSEQWVTIRGQDRTNPVLFVVHGGPGATLSPLPAKFGAMDLRTSPREFALPIVIIQGAEDVDTPIELARDYLDSISAPFKLLVPLERGGHAALVDDAEAFAHALNEHVLPLARAAPPEATDADATLR